MDYCPQDFIPQQNLGNTQITVFYINDTHGNVTKVSKLKPAHDKFKNHNKTKKQHFHIISLKATQSLPYKEALSYQFLQPQPMESQES